MKRTKKWILIYAIGWLVVGFALIGVSGYQWITLGQAMVSVGYAIGGACCIVPAITMFLKWHREEEIELEAYGRQFDEEVAKRQGQLRIDLNAEKEELKDRIKQDKISFAVEQLEKVKSFSISAEDNGWCVTHKDWLDVVEFINNQIKQLKEGK